MGEISVKGPRRILVVDDDPLVNQTLAAGLEELCAAQTWVGRNGEEGLSLAQLHQPDLVLLDLDMPGLDGLATSARLRALPGMAETQVWVVTGLTLDAERLRELARHTDRVLAKPVDFGALAREIGEQVKARGAFLRLLEE